MPGVPALIFDIMRKYLTLLIALAVVAGLAFVIYSEYVKLINTPDPGKDYTGYGAFKQ